MATIFEGSTLPRALLPTGLAACLAFALHKAHNPEGSDSGFELSAALYLESGRPVLDTLGVDKKYRDVVLWAVFAVGASVFFVEACTGRRIRGDVLTRSGHRRTVSRLLTGVVVVGSITSIIQELYTMNVGPMLYHVFMMTAVMQPVWPVNLRFWRFATRVSYVVVLPVLAALDTERFAGENLPQGVVLLLLWSGIAAVLSLKYVYSTRKQLGV